MRHFLLTSFSVLAIFGFSCCVFAQHHHGGHPHASGGHAPAVHSQPHISRPQIHAQPHIQPRISRPQIHAQPHIQPHHQPHISQAPHFSGNRIANLPGPRNVPNFNHGAPAGTRSQGVHRPSHMTFNDAKNRFNSFHNEGFHRYMGLGQPLSREPHRGISGGDDLRNRFHNQDITPHPINRLGGGDGPDHRPDHRPGHEGLGHAGSGHHYHPHPGDYHHVPHDRVMLFNHGFHGYHSYWTDHWYRDHPWAWRPHSSFLPSYWWRPLVWDSVITWGAGYLWRDALADTYVAPEPVYYNYGDNIVYDGDMVYVNGVPYVSADEYYQQTVTLANEGADTSVDQPEESWTQTQNTQVTDSDPDNQWMPLGSFAVLSDPKQTSSHLVLQLAMNKKGVIRGNAYNQVTDKVQQIEGAVDHETQRVAFRITGDKVNTVECGLWNLTQESLPILVHEGKDKTLTRTLIRLNDPDQQAPKE